MKKGKAGEWKPEKMKVKARTKPRNNARAVPWQRQSRILFLPDNWLPDKIDNRQMKRRE